MVPVSNESEQWAATWAFVFDFGCLNNVVFSKCCMGMWTCDMMSPSTARMPRNVRKGTRAFAKSSHAGKLCIGCQPCSNMRRHAGSQVSADRCRCSK